MCEVRRRIFERTPARSHSADETGKVFNKFVTWDRDSCYPDKFIRTVSPWFTYIDRGNGFREFGLKGDTKASGIDFTARLLGQPLSSCFVIGDSMNDLPMLEYVQHSILMGNGVPALKEKVEFVTKSVTEDGIEFALKHYGLI